MERKFLRQKEGHYKFRSESRTTGLIALFKKIHIVEESYWRFIDTRFEPLLYTYQHTKNKKNRQVTINFDWSKQQIINKVNDSIWYMQTKEGMLDKLLYQLAIMSDLKAGHIPKKYTIADGGKIKHYSFEYINNEEIDTPLGTFTTIKLARYKSNNTRKTILWCAHDLEFLPIRVEHTEKDGRLTRAIIKSLNGLGFNVQAD